MPPVQQVTEHQHYQRSWCNSLSESQSTKELIQVSHPIHKTDQYPLVLGWWYLRRTHQPRKLERSWGQFDFIQAGSDKWLIGTHLAAISSINFKQIWVFPIPPIPYSRNNFLFWTASLVLVKKCFLSLVITSVRPVNRVLGFGIRGMTPSDVVLLPWMLTCNRSKGISLLEGHL